MHSIGEAMLEAKGEVGAPKKGKGDGRGRARSLAVNEADKSSKRATKWLSLSEVALYQRAASKKTQTQEKNETLFGRWSCEGNSCQECAAACEVRNKWVPCTSVP